MRYLTAPVGYLIVVLSVLAAASAAVVNLYAMTSKPNRDWDADIDRIVAQQQEKKRLAALLPAADAELPLADESQARAETTASVGDPQSDREPAAAKKVQTAAQASRKPGRRAARRGEHFVPPAFASLPKFAAATAVSAILRLR